MREGQSQTSNAEQNKKDGEREDVTDKQTRWRKAERRKREWYIA